MGEIVANDDAVSEVEVDLDEDRAASPGQRWCIGAPDDAVDVAVGQCQPLGAHLLGGEVVGWGVDPPVVHVQDLEQLGLVTEFPHRIHDTRKNGSVLFVRCWTDWHDFLSK